MAIDNLQFNENHEWTLGEFFQAMLIVSIMKFSGKIPEKANLGIVMN